MEGREDRAKFSVLLFWLAERMASPGGKPKDIDEILEDYFQALADIRIERIEWGARHIFATERWFPMPVEIRDAAMLAPSSVLPALQNNQKQLCEFSEEEIVDAKRRFAELAEELPDLAFTVAVTVPGCRRPVYQL
jgi:hypothetical protein